MLCACIYSHNMEARGQVIGLSSFLLLCEPRELISGLRRGCKCLYPLSHPSAYNFKYSLKQNNMIPEDISCLIVYHLKTLPSPSPLLNSTKAYYILLTNSICSVFNVVSYSHNLSNTVQLKHFIVRPAKHPLVCLHGIFSQ